MRMKPLVSGVGRWARIYKGPFKGVDGCWTPGLDALLGTTIVSNLLALPGDRWHTG